MPSSAKIPADVTPNVRVAAADTTPDSDVSRRYPSVPSPVESHGHGHGHGHGHDRSQAASPGPRIYLGSYSRRRFRSRLSLDASLASDAQTPLDSPASSHPSLAQAQLHSLLKHVELDLDTYGLEELRDGFFDAIFLPPANEDEAELEQEAIATLPPPLRRHHPLSVRYFFPKQWHDIKDSIHRITTTRAGVRLLKSFLGYFIPYIICLIPVARNWLGPYNYVMAISAVLNHPGRTVGSQIDGAILTILGTAAGLGWGSLALWVSTSTSAAQAGYGGILATFLILFTAVLAWLRCIYIRLFQGVIAAGIAICYTCLADTSRTVGWKKILDYGVPWVLGQAVCLIVVLVVFPDAGARPLAYVVPVHR